MSRHKYLLVMLAVICYSCSGGDAADENLYDYDELEEISLELDVEIGEREGYIPGTLNNVIVTEDGSILVSDAGNIRIDQYSADGTHVRTIATEGNGPGEVPQYFSIADMGMGKYIVRSPNGTRSYLERQPNGDFIFGEPFLTQPFPGRGRMVQFAKDDEEFYAIASNRLTIQSPQDIPEVTIRHVAIANELGELLQDSLQAIRIPSSAYYTANSGFPIPYQIADELVNMGGGRYMITRPEENSLEIYGPDFELERTISLPFKPRPFSTDDIEQYIVSMITSSGSSITPEEYLDQINMTQSVQNEIAERVGDYKPLFVDIWVWEEEEKFLLKTDYGVDTNEMVVIDSDGSPIGKFNLPITDTVYYFRDNKVYTIHTDPARGYFVRVYSLTI